MTFADDDLKRLKERSEKHNFSTNGLVSREHLDALLARLEAVERYARYMRTKHPGWYNPQYEAWRKAAGK